MCANLVYFIVVMVTLVPSAGLHNNIFHIHHEPLMSTIPNITFLLFLRLFLSSTQQTLMLLKNYSGPIHYPLLSTVTFIYILLPYIFITKSTQDRLNIVLQITFIAMG